MGFISESKRKLNLSYDFQERLYEGVRTEMGTE